MYSTLLQCTVSIGSVSDENSFVDLSISDIKALLVREVGAFYLSLFWRSAADPLAAFLKEFSLWCGRCYSLTASLTHTQWTRDLSN